MKRALLILMICLIKLSTEKVKSYPPIVTLGNSLIGRIQNYTCEDAELLLRDTRRYYTMLDDLYNQMTSKSREDVNKGMAVFNIVEEFGGPPHVSAKIDYKLLEQKYTWNSETRIDQFKTVLENTKEIWKTMEERANWLRNGIPDPETEESESSSSETMPDSSE